jgi:hypothetical protein
VDGESQDPRLPAGVDDEDYWRIRRLMRVSVLSLWKAKHEVIAGMDPWDVVDEAWSSMAHNNSRARVHSSHTP